ncbi:MAG: hypothetical protein HVN35_00765 [Methanobacteriaceae archaeon]|nr:hypothetical protein [Methanobacteriaceae archaeon]
MKMLTVELFDINEPWVVVDGTGYSTDQYSHITHRTIEKQNKKRIKATRKTK